MKPAMTLNPTPPAYDIDSIRADFPVLNQPMNGKRLAFLDTAASAQKPRQVIEAMSTFLAGDYANIHRGLYALSARSTQMYEGTRDRVAQFINAASGREIVFTRNATEAINLVAATWGVQNLGEGDEIILSLLEHHANIVPWQMLRERTGCVIKVVPLCEDGSLDMAAYRDMLGPRVKLVSLTHMSNALGVITEAEELVSLARQHGATVLLDGCQAVQHLTVDVQRLDCDFYVFSGHKIYGPSGIGVLYGKADVLASMPPYQTGGDMIEYVTFEKTTFQKPPQRFEAGTPPIAEAIGLTAALDYVDSVGLDAIAAHEATVLEYGQERLMAVEGVTIQGSAAHRASVISFTVKGLHPHDMGTILDKHGIAVRAGHHCAFPLMQHLGVPATTRASLGLYNTTEDIDQLVEGIEAAKALFGA